MGHERMNALASPGAYPLLFLRGRITYRTLWAMREHHNRTLSPEDLKWEVRYDLVNNFASVNQEFVERERQQEALSKTGTRFKKSRPNAHLKGET